MRDKFFLDSNILIYSIGKDKVKKRKSIDLIKQKPVISVQVLNELSNVMIRKLKLEIKRVSDLLDFLSKNTTINLIDISTIKKGLYIITKYKYSYYDSLIIASALESDCKILYTEDMQNEQLVENSLKIINPFV